MAEKSLQKIGGVANLDYISPGTDTFTPTQNNFAEFFERGMNRVRENKEKEVEAAKAQKINNMKIMRDYDSEHWLRHGQYFQEEQGKLFDVASTIMAEGGDLTDMTNPLVLDWHRQGEKLKRQAAYSQQIKDRADNFSKYKPEDLEGFTPDSRKQYSEFIYGKDFKTQLEAFENGQAPNLVERPALPTTQLNAIIDELNKDLTNRGKTDEAEVAKNNEELYNAADVALKPYEGVIRQYFGDEAPAFIEGLKSQVKGYYYDKAAVDKAALEQEKFEFTKQNAANNYALSWARLQKDNKTNTYKIGGKDYDKETYEEDYRNQYYDLVAGKQDAISFYNRIPIGDKRYIDNGRMNADKTAIVYDVYNSDNNVMMEPGGYVLDLTNPAETNIQDFRDYHLNAVSERGLYNTYRGDESKTVPSPSNPGLISNDLFTKADVNMLVGKDIKPLESKLPKGYKAQYRHWNGVAAAKKVGYKITNDDNEVLILKFDDPDFYDKLNNFTRQESGASSNFKGVPDGGF